MFVLILKPFLVIFGLLGYGGVKDQIYVKDLFWAPGGKRVNGKSIIYCLDTFGRLILAKNKVCILWWKWYKLALKVWQGIWKYISVNISFIFINICI